MNAFSVGLNCESFECQKLSQVKTVLVKLIYTDKLSNHWLSACVPPTVLDRSTVTNRIIEWIRVAANSKLQLYVSVVVLRIMKSVVNCDEKNRVYSNLSLILSFDRQPFSWLSFRGVVIGRRATQVSVTRIESGTRSSVII